MSSESSSSDSNWEFDSDSSSGDELLEILIHNHQRPKNEGYLEVTVPLYNDKEFVEHFRVGRQMAQDIAYQFEESEFSKSQTGGNGKLSAYDQTLIFLWFAGHATSSFRDVGDRFDITISCVFYVLRRLIHFLSGISVSIIKWPSDMEKVDIERHFRERGFPGVIGAIDGSHVRIDKPNIDPDSYLNRKHFHSIQDIHCYDSLLMQFTWHGTKIKKGMETTKLGQAVLRAAEETSVYVDRKSTGDAMKKFLRRAKERNAYELKGDAVER